MNLRKISEYKWEVPKEGGMRVPGVIYASERMLKEIEQGALRQVKNVAHLPGIVGYSIAMPDIHTGYGFPIGGVAATRVSDGVISPGGIGYDINCGVRLLRTNLKVSDVKKRLRELLRAIYDNVPCGVGEKGKLRLSRRELEEVLVEGARWMVRRGLGKKEDLIACEEGGAIKGADPGKVPPRAYERGQPQLGTLGAGNHFLEIQEVVEVYDEKLAEEWGLRKGFVTCMIHTGSRGFGHQVCSDYLRVLERAVHKYGIHVPDKELACAPINSEEGQSYIKAMFCAANYAWANRQAITHWVRESFMQVFGIKEEELGLELVYDVAHNIGKFEKHIVDGKEIEVCVHRKGATRAFPAGHPALPEKYRKTGQPVLIPGDMGTASYVLVGTELAMKETFGTTAHGAGRVMSRHEAIRRTRGRNIEREMAGKGIMVMAKSEKTLHEEVPEAYKDVDIVVDVTHRAGISRKVCKMRPIGVVKG